MVKNMQGLSRKTSTQSFHHQHINSPPPTFEFPLHLREKVEEERRNSAYADYLRQLELVHEQSKQCLRIEQQKLDSMLQSATQHAQSYPTTAAADHAPIMATAENAEDYAKPFCSFLTDNPTVFHAVDSMAQDLKHDGFTKLSERDSWCIEPGGKYFVERNGSSLIAFVVGDDYKAGNGAAVLAGHVDALTAKLKPVSKIPNKSGFIELGVAPYAGGLGATWWDRDLSIGGRVLVKEGNKIVTKLVKLGWPIAKIPTLAPHFGAPANGPFNLETQVVPIIGLESSAKSQMEPQAKAGSFAATQPPRLVRAIANELGVAGDAIINWELELYDIQPATLAGLDKEFISAGRIDDKLCSWAALEALKQSARNGTSGSGIIKIVGLFDDEEIGSGLRQGARGNFLPIVMERAVGSLAGQHPASDLMGRTYANSFLVSSDVTHAVNPNFESVYLANHAPELNVGVVVSADSNGHMTTDGLSTAIFTRCAEKIGATLQVFQIRNDSRSGGTVGPMLSCATGMRAIDAGIPQLSMHSIRATTGTSDPGLGVMMFQGFLDGYESVDAEFKE
jgi:aminopeptidase I